MPLTEEERKQRRRERDKEYYKKNKEKKNEYNRQYQKKNKEKINEYKEKNKEKINKYQKNYQKVHNYDKNPKKFLKSNWKRRGVIWKDEKEFESIWKEYTTQTHCEFCYKVFSEGMQNIKCLDHDHENGEFRFILCGYCNLQRISD